MNVRTLVNVVIALFMSVGKVLAWGSDGHAVTGSIADQLLNPRAKAEIKRILGFELRVAAPWADCVRSVVRNEDDTFKYAPPIAEFRIPCTPFETPEEIRRMEDYAARNWAACAYEGGRRGCQDTYHFTDVAIQHDRYDRAYLGTSDHEVVSAINAAILVLKHQPAPQPFSTRDKKEALFLLAHFLGYLHQPLHIGSVYLNADGKLVNPDQSGSIHPETETAGGNFIFDLGKKLHSEWDATQLTLATPRMRVLLTRAIALSGTPGPMADFAVTWATDTILASHSAFAGMTFIKAGDRRWVAQIGDRPMYLETQDRLKREQLAEGGARLAKLLNAIWPAESDSTDTWALRSTLAVETKEPTPKTKLVFSRGHVVAGSDQRVDAALLETLVVERNASDPQETPFSVSAGAACTVKYVLSR